MPTFVIQEHHARQLHWDFRLELSGVLKSWAIPKIPPTRKGVKRLAIKVADHPKSYGNFEGEITEGYGKGKVRIWDKGNFSLKERTPQKIVFTLQGKILKGNYALIKTNYEGKDDTWLLMKIS